MFLLQVLLPLRLFHLMEPMRKYRPVFRLMQQLLRCRLIRRYRKRSLAIE
jgi:hypothetical protein